MGDLFEAEDHLIVIRWAAQKRGEHSDGAAPTHIIQKMPTKSRKGQENCKNY